MEVLSLHNFIYYICVLQDVKMKKMAELQLTVVTDPRSRQAIIKQIAQWEENLEKLYIEQYRLRCYISTLQGTELPNPKVGVIYSVTTLEPVLISVTFMEHMWYTCTFSGQTSPHSPQDISLYISYIRPLNHNKFS